MNSTTTHRNRPFIAAALIIAAILIAFLLAPKVRGADIGTAIDTAKAVRAAYEKGQLNVLPFASAHINDSKPDYGGGLAIGYSLSKNSVLEAEAVSTGASGTDTFQTFLRDLGANLKLYVPVKTTGFAPYGIFGYRYDLQDSENQITAGIGVEHRFKLIGIAGGVFLDGRFIHGFTQAFDEFGNEGIVRLGVSGQF
jgi:hypothetical protein